MPTITKNKIIFDHKDWLAGLHPQYGVGCPAILSGLDTASLVDPLREIGVIMPGPDTVDVTNVSEVDAVIRNGVLASDGYVYAVGGISLHKINKTTGGITNDGNWSHTIASSAMSDVIEYYIGTTPYVFYSWNDSTDGDVGRLIPATPTFDDDFMSTVPADAAVLNKDYEHPLVIGDDDCMYIGDGRNLHKFDGQTGANGTLTANKLQLPTGFEIKSFAKIEPNSLVVFAEYDPSSGNTRGQVKAFFWDYLNKDSYKIKDIWGASCGAAFEYRGSVACFSGGTSTDKSKSTRRTHLSIFSGDRFQLIRSVNGDSIPIHGGVDVLGDIIYANCGGLVYVYGNIYGELDIGVQQTTRGSGSSSGMFKIFGATKTLISSGATTSGGLEYLDYSTYKDNAAIETTFAEPNFNIGKMGMIERMIIWSSDIASGGRALSINVQSRNGKTPAFDKCGLTTITKPNFILELFDGEDWHLKTFDALQLTVSWETGDGNTDAPKIRKVEVYYKEVNIIK